MALIIPSGHGHFAYVWTSTLFASGGAATTWGMGSHEPPELTANQAAVAARKAWTDVMRNQIDQQITLQEIVVTTSQQRAVLPVGQAGTQNRTLPPPNTSLLVKKVTATRGRRAQGRNFWPGMVGENSIDEGGYLLPADLTALQTAINNWSAQLITDIGHPFVILQNSEGETPPLSPPPPVIAQVVQAKVATQRRRLRR